MQLIVTKAASKWLINNLKLKVGEGVKFFPKDDQVPVKHGPHQGFAKDNQPDRPILEVNQDGINYHINFADDWFFSARTTTVDYSDDQGLFFTFTADPDTVAGASVDYEKYLM